MNVNDDEMNGNSLEAWMREWRGRFGEELDRALPAAETRPALVHEAMRYAALNGGKRLRAMLCVSACEGVGGEAEWALRPALAIEIFHASTLVHDDLPCMDDDGIRRGKPATHIRYGEANALLAGNALLTLAMEWMAREPVPPPHAPGALVCELARAGGSEGVIGGQVEDLAAEDVPPDEETLWFIHREKTARLIACACRCGAVRAGASAARVEAMGDFGLQVGLAFQILDDVLDATQSTEVLGKPAGSDAERRKLTSVSLWGVEGSRARAREATEWGLARLEEVGPSSSRLRDLTVWLLGRES